MSNTNNEVKTKTTRLNARYLAGTAMLSAVAFVLQYFDFPIPFLIPEFIKFDFSDLPALVGAFAYGPLAGVIIELVKNVLHLVVSKSMFIGELSNFILGASFACTAGFIYAHKKNKKSALIGGVVGAVVMGVVSIFANYFIVYPVYVAVFFGGNEEACVNMYRVIAPSMKSLMQCLVCFNFPFTTVKGLVSTAITMLIYKPLSPVLKGRK